jgi:hypothetical protein
MRSRAPFVTATILLAALAAPSRSAPAQQPPRDTPAQPQNASPERPALIAGRVLDAATGLPMVRSVVRLTAPELPGGRAVVTDGEGAFEFGGLPPGRYTVTARKTGYIALSYGQRRPLQPGTPLQLAAGQSLRGVDLSLPRGSVISGVILDELGNPLPATAVRVLRYEYAEGARQLVRAGTAETDDRGYYRVWGLNPGEYYVSAVARNPDLRGGRGGGGSPAPDASEPPEGYAPTYYPGVPSPQEAAPVSVGLGAEAENITFGALLVRTARVTGRLLDADPSPAPNGNVTLLPEGQTGRGPLGPSYGARIGRDGRFTIENVPPGRYLLRAVGGNGANRQFGVQPLTLVGGEVHDLVVVLTPGATLTGTVTLGAPRSDAPPNVGDFRITAPALEPGGPNAAGDARADGTFTLRGIQPGLHWIRAQAPSGWMLESVVVEGRETIDTPLELRGGQTIANVRIGFTNRVSELNGAVTDTLGAPATEYTVLAFAGDPALWRPQSRQIATARPDQNGRFQIRGLPAGDYYVAAIDPVEPGEWFEPSFLSDRRGDAVRVTIREGEVKTQDLRVSTR